MYVEDCGHTNHGMVLASVAAEVSLPFHKGETVSNHLIEGPLLYPGSNSRQVLALVVLAGSFHQGLRGQKNPTHTKTIVPVFHLQEVKLYFTASS